MKYIKDETPFISIEGSPYRIEDDGVLNDASLYDVIKVCLRPFPFKPEHKATVASHEACNKVLALLKAGPDADGYFTLETADYNIVKGILEQTSPDIIKSNCVHLMRDIIEKALDEPPVESTKSQDNGRVKAAAEVPV